MADYTIITTNNPGRESAAQIAQQVERGFELPSHPYHIQLDRAQAIYDLVNMAQPGDVVLITGKGAETHQEFADTIVPFDDREVAVHALEVRMSPVPKELARRAAGAHVEIPTDRSARSDSSKREEFYQRHPELVVAE